MLGNIRFSRWLVGAAILIAAECAGVAAVELALTHPAQAQRADDRYPFQRRQQQGGGFFGWFGGGGGYNSRSYPGEHQQQQQAPAQYESSR